MSPSLSSEIAACTEGDVAVVHELSRAIPKVATAKPAQGPLNLQGSRGNKLIMVGCFLSSVIKRRFAVGGSEWISTLVFKHLELSLAVIS